MKTRKLFFAAIAMAVMAVHFAQAQTTYTFTNRLAATHDWTVAGNWDVNGVPVGANDATIRFFADTTTALASGTNSISSDPSSLTMNVLTLNGKGAASGVKTTLNIGTPGNTWTLDGTTPTINLNAIEGGVGFEPTFKPNFVLNQNLNITGNGTATMIANYQVKGPVFSGSISGNYGITKNGSTAFSLGGNNSYTGGTVLNAGTIHIANNNALGSGNLTFANNAKLIPAYGGNHTLTNAVVVNDGYTAEFNVINGNYKITFSGPLTGSGTLYVNNTDSSANGTATFSSTNNTFTGRVKLGSANTGYLKVNSLSDSLNPIEFTATGTAGGAFELNSGDATPLVFNQRQILMSSSKNYTATINNNNANVANTITINTALLFTGTGTRTLTLGGSNTGNNTFAGSITNNGASAVSVIKTDGGIWCLGGTNTYSGDTSLLAVSTTGVLIFQGSQSLSPSTKLMFAQNSSNVQKVRFLSDGAGTINFGSPMEFGGGNTSQALGISVGNNNTANGGSSSGTTTDSTIVAGNLTFTSVAGDTHTTSINITGADGYRLQLGTVTLNNLASRNAGQTTTTKFNPTTANVTVSAITMQAGNTGVANDGIPVLNLDGTTSDNRVIGTISDASDVAPAGSGIPLSLTKTSSSIWILSGTNTYSGTTTVSAGRLVLARGTCLSDTNLVTISGTGKLQIEAGVKEKVGLLKLGTILQSTGTYGSSLSAATTTNDTYFAGSGLLYVGIDIPASGTLIQLK